MLRFGVVTDIHFGPPAHFDGKLRKLTARAPALARAFAHRMRDVVRPDLVVQLGDCIEDESAEADRKRYRACLDVLRESGCELISVAGNHDRVHHSHAELTEAWALPEAPADGLFYSLNRHGVHFAILATHENKDVDVRIDDAQLAWLDADLAGTSAPTVVLMHHAAAEQDLRDNRWFRDHAHLGLIHERDALRRVIASHAHVVLVLNGHLHWNHAAVIDGVPYVTLQSLIENLDDDAPGRPANAHAVVTIDSPWVHVAVHGAEPNRYTFRR